MAAKNRDLSRQVYTRLREAILSSELLPGHKLSHQALAERLGVSHTPLREAFGKLKGAPFELDRRSLFRRGRGRPGGDRKGGRDRRKRGRPPADDTP